MSPDKNDLSDAISLTSTLESDEDQDFEVECILAEREDSDEDGEDTTLYLVQWTGYAPHRNSWEPDTSFNSDETLQTWEARKREIAAGKREPFDVGKWEAYCRAEAKKTKKRKAKRRRLRERKALEEAKAKASNNTGSNLGDVEQREPQRRSSLDSVASSALFVPQDTPPSLSKPGVSTQPQQPPKNPKPATLSHRALSGSFVSAKKASPPKETNSLQQYSGRNPEPTAEAHKQKAPRELTSKLARAATANSHNSRSSKPVPSSESVNAEKVKGKPTSSHKKKPPQPLLVTGSKNTATKKTALAEFGAPVERKDAYRSRWADKPVPLTLAIDPKKPSEYARRTMMGDGTPAMLQSEKNSPTSQETQHQIFNELQTSITDPSNSSGEASNIPAQQTTEQEVPPSTPVPTTTPLASHASNSAEPPSTSSPAHSLANPETNIDETFVPRGSLSPIDRLGTAPGGSTGTDLIQTIKPPDSSMAPRPPKPQGLHVSTEATNRAEAEISPDTRNRANRFGPFTLESPTSSVDVYNPSDQTWQPSFARQYSPRRGSPVRYRSPGRRQSSPGRTYRPRQGSFSRGRSVSRSPERRSFSPRRSPLRYRSPDRRQFSPGRTYRPRQGSFSRGRSVSRSPERRSFSSRRSPLRYRSPDRRQFSPGRTYRPRQGSFSRYRSVSRSPERRSFFSRRSHSPRYSPLPHRGSRRSSPIRSPRPRRASPPEEMTTRRPLRGGNSHRPESDRRSIALENSRPVNMRTTSSASDLAAIPTGSNTIPTRLKAISARDPEDARIDDALIAQMPIRMAPIGATKTPEGYWWDRENDELLVHVYFGPEKKKVGALRLCGLDRFVKLDLIRVGKTPHGWNLEIWFKHVCTADQYDRLSEPNADNTVNTVNTGWFEGFADNNSKLFHMAKGLQMDDRIAICYLPRYSLVAWSRGSPSYMFPPMSNKTLPLDVEIPLLVAVLEGLPPIQTLDHRTSFKSQDTSIPATVSDSNLPPQAENNRALTGFIPPLASKAPEDVQREATAGLETLMAERKINVDELATIEDGAKSSKANYFYLHFPSDDDEVQADLHLLKSYLSIHGMTVLTSIDPNGWSNFHNNSKMGVVIFHESFSGYSELQPALNLVLHNAPFNYWVIRITRPLQLMDERFFSSSEHCTRIFLRDAVILLTEDMLGDLKGFAITLQWLRQRQQTRQSSTTYHFMLQPGMMEWLERRLDDEKLAKDHGLLGLIKALIMKLNVSDLRKELFNESSLDPDSSNAIMSYPVYDYGTRTELDEPRIKDRALRNADHLIEFFAGWALLNRQRFKHFIVLTSFAKSPISRRWASWGHIRVIHEGFPAFFERFHVKDTNGVWARLCTEARPGTSQPTTPLSATNTPRTPNPRTPKATSVIAQSVLQGNQAAKSPEKYPAPYR